MRNAFLFFMFIYTMSAQESLRLHGDYEFENNSIQYLFGDNVKLRMAPNTDSEVIELMKIGSTIEIVQKTTESLFYDGYDSAWYEIKYNGKKGYVVGGLIALAHKNIKNTTCLIAMKKDADNEYVKTRLVQNEDSYVELINEIRTPQFYVEFSNGRGLPYIEHIIHIDYLADACGVEGGGFYIFDDGIELFKALEYSEISEAGIFWYREEYRFPTDEKGTLDRLVYESEQGNSIDEATNWVEIKRVEREFEWKNRQLIPDMNSKDN